MTDILVLGGGIAGLGISLFLARSGHHVQLVEPDAAPVPADPERAFASWSRGPRLIGQEDPAPVGEW